MATTELTHFEPHSVSLVRRIAEGCGAFVHAVARSARNRRAVKRMLELDDWMLRDIGVTRHDVRNALATRFDEDPAYRLTIFSGTHAAHGCGTLRRDI
jgi:uncharacterized protein YjiS (DUF1127 family)